MRKTAAILAALALIFSITACKSESASTSANFVSSSSAVPAIPVKEESTSMDILESNHWTLTYDPDVWVFDQEFDFINDDFGSRVIMTIPDGETSYIANAEIRVVLDEPNEFRNMLVTYGFDQYGYAENNAYDTVSVGNVDCLVHEGEYWGDPALRYFSRAESAGATVFIEIIGEYEDPRVEELLSGLTFHLDDVGNVDVPWPWEGTPFSGETRSAAAGDYTLIAEWIPFTEPRITDNIFGHTAAVLDDKVCLFGDGTLKQYAFDGTSLIYEKDVSVSGNYEAIQATRDGTLWMSGLMEPLAAFENGEMRMNYEGHAQVSMHPSGEWGVSWFYGQEGTIITPKDDILESTPIVFPAVTGITNLNVDENYIFVCGDVTDGTGHKVCLYTADGTLWNLLTDATGSGLGSISYVTETENGFLGLDSDTCEIVLWDKDGEYMTAIDAGELFGTRYPWFCHAVKLLDGSVLVFMTDERADGSATELIAFKLSGF